MDRNGKLQILEMRMDLSSSESVGCNHELVLLLLSYCYCHYCFSIASGMAISGTAINATGAELELLF